ncbi:MAG: uroporphyrinogen-III synthase, partial [Proteobacteria bacterium]|nr:uroporphyrinogen-III synthase [Pseudomonadota bacterium]
MRILITRPGEDAAPLAAMLRAKGHVVVVAPLLDIQPLRDATISLDGIQAILLTSANGARALAKADPRRDLPVLAVGEATAAAARAAGFTAVDNAGGDVSDLAALAKTRFDPNKGALLHAAGSVIAGDLGGALAAGGFELRRVVIYRAEPATVLPAAAAAALRDGSLDAALFFSPRTAATFVRLVREAGLEAACRRVVALGLSPAVIEAANGIGWAATMAAASPKEAALVDALDRLAQHGAPSADPASPMTEPQPTQSPKPNTEPTSTRAAAIPAPRWLAVVAVGAAVAALALAGWQANLPKGD